MFQRYRYLNLQCEPPLMPCVQEAVTVRQYCHSLQDQGIMSLLGRVLVLRAPEQAYPVYALAVFRLWLPIQVLELFVPRLLP